MQVKEILRVKGNRLLSIEPSGRAVDAVTTMASENLGSLVVMDQGRMVGVLTFHELLRALADKRGTLGETRVADLKQNFNLFRYELNLDFSMDTTNRLDRRLGLAAGILLAAVEGKQSS